MLGKQNIVCLCVCVCVCACVGVFVCVSVCECVGVTHWTALPVRVRVGGRVITRLAGARAG